MKEKIGSIMKIAYMPSLSGIMKAFIKQNVNPSMEDEETSQYHVDFIFEAISDQEFNTDYTFRDGVQWREWSNKEDLELLTYLVDIENVDYIEF